jgi:hypothetical protein
LNDVVPQRFSSEPLADDGYGPGWNTYSDAGTDELNHVYGAGAADQMVIADPPDDEMSGEVTGIVSLNAHFLPGCANYVTCPQETELLDADDDEVRSKRCSGRHANILSSRSSGDIIRTLPADTRLALIKTYDGFLTSIAGRASEC